MANKKSAQKGAWSDGKLLGWGIFWLLMFFPVGIGMLLHYRNRKANRQLPPVVPWSAWGADVHQSRQSADRMHRAMSQGFRFRPYSVPGVYTVKGSEGDTYFVSFGGCTCQDFVKRGRPCKHMYALAIQRGGFDPAPYLWEDDV